MITKDMIGEKLKPVRFMTFRTEWEYDDRGFGNSSRSATLQLNEWLEANPNIEIIDWKAFAVGTGTDYNITVQYKER